MKDLLKQGIDDLKNKASNNAPVPGSKKEFKNGKDLARSLMSDQEAINDIETTEPGGGIKTKKFDKWGFEK